MSASRGVSTGVFGTNLDDKVSQIWKQVKFRVVQMAGGDSSRIRPNLDINSVQKHFDQSQSKDKKASEKYATVNNTFNRTLQCNQTVGGIVADGESYLCAFQLPSPLVILTITIGIRSSWYLLQCPHLRDPGLAGLRGYLRKPRWPSREGYRVPGTTHLLHGLRDGFKAHQDCLSASPDLCGHL